MFRATDLPAQKLLFGMTGAHFESFRAWQKAYLDATSQKYRCMVFKNHRETMEESYSQFVTSHRNLKSVARKTDCKMDTPHPSHAIMIGAASFLFTQSIRSSLAIGAGALWYMSTFGHKLPWSTNENKVQSLPAGCSVDTHGVHPRQTKWRQE